MAMRAFVLSVVFNLLANPVSSQTSGSYGPKLHRIMQGYHAAGLFQGAVLVAMGDQVIVREAYGMANVEWDVANTPQTRFSIASLGKAFTAAIVLQLQEQGLLSVDDRISTHLTGYPAEIGDNVTIHQLLGHTAGIPWPQDEWIPEQFVRRYALEDLVEMTARESLLFEPGTQFQYCNSCYHLLAAIVEAISGNAFEDELRRRILEPLGMHDTGIAYADPIIHRRASGYERDDAGRLVNALRQDQSYAVGAGGMYSTVDDLYKWHRALEGTDLLSAQSKERMFEPGLNSSGYGWAMGKYKKKGAENLRTLAVGYGGTYGFASGMARLLDDGYFIVFLGNIRHVPQNQLMNDLWNTILGFEVEPLEK